MISAGEGFAIILGWNDQISVNKVFTSASVLLDSMAGVGLLDFLGFLFP